VKDDAGASSSQERGTFPWLFARGSSRHDKDNSERKRGIYVNNGLAEAEAAIYWGVTHISMKKKVNQQWGGVKGWDHDGSILRLPRLT